MPQIRLRPVEQNAGECETALWPPKPVAGAGTDFTPQHLFRFLPFAPKASGPLPAFKIHLLAFLEWVQTQQSATNIGSPLSKPGPRRRG